MNLDLLKKLRNMTGAGILDCKNALKESSGNLEDAVTFLRKQGIAKSFKKSDRQVKEGRIVSLLSEDLKKGVLVQINCETDFVSRNEQFVQLSENVSKILLEGSSEHFDQSSGSLLDGSLKDKVTKCIQEGVISLGENLKLSHAFFFQTEGLLSSYIHLGGKIGVLLKINSKGNVSSDVLKDICMHIAASHPLYLKKEDVPQKVLDKEKEIVLEQNKNKPEKFLDKIVTGKLNKYFSEVCLLNQAFVKDPSQSITQLLQGADISSFVRLELSVN